MVDSKEQTQKELEDKKAEKPSMFSNLHPAVIIVAGILLFLAFKAIAVDSEKGTNYFFLALVVIGVIWLLSKQGTEKVGLVSPKEAELLAERECERKLRWGQWPLMTTYKIGPVSDLAHKDSRGLHYEVNVEVRNPAWGAVKYYVAMVQANGQERGFCTLREAIAPLTGRAIQQIHDITKPPEWLRRTQRYPILEKIWMGGNR